MDADDWLIAPPINYKKGKIYQLKFTAYSSMSDYPEDMDVTFGRERTPEAQNEVLMDLRMIPTELDEDAPDYYSTTFTVPEDGVYYYGFHVVSPKYHEILWLYDISVTEYVPAGVEQTLADGDVRVTTDNGTMNVTTAKATQISVADTSGRTVAKAFGRSLHAPLRSGIYIVSAGGKTMKVAVK